MVKVCLIFWFPWNIYDHCYACTVGSGSSCQGALEEDAKSIKNINVKDTVSDYYGNELKDKNDLKTSACCTINDIAPQIKEAFKDIADEIQMKFYGCGSPIQDSFMMK